MKSFKADQPYMIEEGWRLNCLRSVALKLYSEERMTGDEMRDMAQIAEMVLDAAEAVETLDEFLGEKA